MKKVVAIFLDDFHTKCKKQLYTCSVHFPSEPRKVVNTLGTGI